MAAAVGGDFFFSFPASEEKPTLNQTILTRMTRPIIDKLFLHRMTVRQEREGRSGGWGGRRLDEWNDAPLRARGDGAVCLSDSIKSVALWRTKLSAPCHALAAIIRS